MPTLAIPVLPTVSSIPTYRIFMVEIICLAFHLSVLNLFKFQKFNFLCSFSQHEDQSESYRNRSTSQTIYPPQQVDPITANPSVQSNRLGSHHHRHHYLVFHLLRYQANRLPLWVSSLNNFNEQGKGKSGQLLYHA